MFFEDQDDEIYINNPDIYHFVSREVFSNRDRGPAYGIVRDIPTHTEDGIPIRKLYVSNLPPKTTRAELFGLFAQYGFIKSCWLRIGEKGPDKRPTPSYAFVTYGNPADAHKALKAPHDEKYLQGRFLKILPADSWHQPIQDADGRVRWKVRSQNHGNHANHGEGQSSAGVVDTENRENSENAENTENVINDTEQAETSSAAVSEAPIDIELPESDETYSILDILNSDCLDHILNFVPILHVIQTERVSKQWQSMVLEHIKGRRTFKTSWCKMPSKSLTTAMLRRVLQKLGGSLNRLHIDHHWSALNDRTAHVVGKFCKHLEEFRVVGMQTKNWNPLLFGCKLLKHLKFVNCNKLTDPGLVPIVKNDSIIESLMVANNTHVTGLFLTGSNPPKLKSLSFYNCYSLQGTVICAAVDKLKQITTLRLDMCPISMWKIVPMIINKLPKLEELSVSEYTSVDCLYVPNKDFCDSIAKLTELKILNLSKNIYITNEVLKEVANSCPKLESLNISCCNPRKTYPGVGDEGLDLIFAKCKQLSWLDVSYLAGLTDTGLCAARNLSMLKTLISRGNPALTSRPFVACLSACRLLQNVDASGCDSVTKEVICAAVLALDVSPRYITLHLAATTAAYTRLEIPSHKYLTVNLIEDLSNPNLRPDFIDEIFDDSSEDSFDDMFDGYADGDELYVELGDAIDIELIRQNFFYM